MKLDVINDSLAQTDIAKMSVNIDNLTYSLMIDGIYTNKLNSVVRELATNARDSHKTVDNLDPYTITLTANGPNSNGVLFSIRDEGLGLSKEDSETYLCNLNASNKRESDETTGCFGIGSKSPFSLTDNYSFNCIKDGIKTELNLFRVHNETPRYTLHTKNTSEVNSVECILKLNEYSLRGVLEAIYVELALFDIQPNIKIILPSTEFLISPEDFFCNVQESEDFYRMSFKEFPTELEVLFEGAGHTQSPSKTFYDCLKHAKKVSCGVVGYQSVSLNSPYNNYSRNSSVMSSSYYIIKFDLNSSLKFDVSRENITQDSATSILIKNKIFDTISNINEEESIKLVTLHSILNKNYKTRLHLLTNNVNGPFLDQELPEFHTSLQRCVSGSYNSPISTNTDFIDETLTESLEYYKNNIEELKTICFLSGVSLRNFDYEQRHNTLNLKNFIYNSKITLEAVALLEKIYLNTTIIWEECLNKSPLYFERGSILNYFPNYIFCKYLGSDVTSRTLEDKFKIYSFEPETITDLSEFELDIISNHKQLKNMTQLNRLTSDYSGSNEFSNKLIILYQGLKSLIVDLDLKDNLRSFSRNPCVSVYDLEQYSEVSESFVTSLKKPPRPSTAIPREPGAPRPVQSHNEAGVKLRNKFELKYYKSVSVSTESVLTEESITSLSFYKLLSKSFPKDHYSSFIFMLLINKDIIKTEEEKALLLEEQKNSVVHFIFEIDNLESYSDIKDVCESFLKHEFRVLSAKPLPPIFELNTKFKDEEFLSLYSKILIWLLNTTSVDSAFKDLLSFSEEIPESQLLTQTSDEDVTDFRFTPRFPTSPEDLRSRAILSFTKKLGVNLNSKDDFNLQKASLDFSKISSLLSESIVDNLMSLKDVNYSKSDFGLKYQNTSMFNILNSSMIPALDKFLTLNDNMMYNRMFNLEYLNNLKETKTFPVVSFNTQNLHNLLKEY